MEIIYSSEFVSNLKNPNIKMKIFSCSFLKVDNSYTKEELMRKVRVPVNCSIDRLNDTAFLIEVGMDSVSGSEYLVDGVQFGTYNRLELNYSFQEPGTQSWINKIAGYININQKSSKLFDYARNIIYLDLSVFQVNCEIELEKIKIDNSQDSIYGTIVDHKHNLLSWSDDSSSTSTTNTYSAKEFYNEIKYEMVKPKESRSVSADIIKLSNIQIFLNSEE